MAKVSSVFSAEMAWLSSLWGESRAYLIEILGLGLAVVVTTHVLLNKRDVGSSIGWIGLSWLSPLVGATLYFLFGVNRVARRARRLRGPPRGLVSGGEESRPIVSHHLIPLRQAGLRITKTAPDSGNSVASLRNGDDAYPAMLAAIAGATSCIGLSTYIMRDDAVGLSFVEALAAARSRGVDVRVLVDGIGSGYFAPAIYGRLRDRGVPAGRFMQSPLPWRMPFLNLRSHKKLLVIDGRVAFVGGMNIGSENLVASGVPNPVRDTHFRIDGPVVHQFVDAFARDWAFVQGSEIDPAIWFPPAREAGHATARVVSSGPDEDLEKIEFVMLEAIGCAGSTIRIMTPYLLPSETLVTALSLAAMRGVRVDLLIPHESNHRYVDWAMRAHVEPLLRSGVRIWRNPPPFDHSKLMVVDGEWSFVGSANLDMRSLRLNFELNVEVYDEALGSELDAFMTARQVERLTLDDVGARPLPVKLRDAAVRLASPYL